MTGWLFWISALVLLFTVLVCLRTAISWRRLPDVADTPAEGEDWPRVSVVLAALNEADTIEPALESVLALDYPDLEVVAVNDRSTDATPAILDRLAAHQPRLKVVHIHDLPEGWLGKNHALHQGAERAEGDYLLFTDADVHMRADTLRRSIAHMRREQLDHLALLPNMHSPRAVVRAAIMQLLTGMFIQFRLHRAHHPDTPGFGAGAFNLVRARTYRAVGGHAAVAFTPLDDVALGRLIKRRGHRQGAGLGVRLLQVDWYPSAGAMIRGMEKNTYAAMDYRLDRFMGTMLSMAPMLWPWLGVLIAQGPARWLNVASLAVGLFYYLDLARNAMGWRGHAVLALPLSTLLVTYTLIRAVLLTLWRGEIDWRGTRYPLARLKKAHRALSS